MDVQRDITSVLIITGQARVGNIINRLKEGGKGGRRSSDSGLAGQKVIDTRGNRIQPPSFPVKIHVTQYRRAVTRKRVSI